MMSIIEWVKAHFHGHRQRSKWSFLWRTSVEGLLVALVIGMALKLLFSFPPRHDLHPSIKEFFSIVVFAPFFETIFLQSFPVMIARVLGSHFRGQLLAAWIPFAALHFLAGIATGICAGVVGGFYIAFTYTHWRGVSLRSAFWMTCAYHALHNLGPAIIMLIALKK
jgi:hypothetical protein